MLTVPGAEGWDQLVDDPRDTELETTLAKDRTSHDPSNTTNQTRRDSYEVQGEGSDHGLDQPVTSGVCTRRPTARSKRGVGIHT